MTYIKNQILQNNAIEAWAMAIRYCAYILEERQLWNIVNTLYLCFTIPWNYL